MNCQEFWSQLSQPPGTLFEPGAEHDAHLSACPACATALAQQRKLAAGLRRVAEGFHKLEAPARVEARLLRAFRLGTGTLVPVERKRWPAPLCWAAAAAVLLAASFLLTAGRQPAPPSPSFAGVELATALDPDEVVAGDDGFIPLPNAASVAPGEELDIVRMEVPRSAIMAMGIPVSADRVAEPVEADVLLGPDGLARAVRFLE